MHDFHLADQIFKAIMDYAEKNKLTKVTKAVIELGAVVEHGEDILPANLKFNIDMLAQGTVADGLEIEINKIGSDDWVLKEIEGI